MNFLKGIVIKNGNMSLYASGILLVRMPSSCSCKPKKRPPALQPSQSTRALSVKKSRPPI